MSIFVANIYSVLIIVIFAFSFAGCVEFSEEYSPSESQPEDNSENDLEPKTEPENPTTDSAKNASTSTKDQINDTKSGSNGGQADKDKKIDSPELSVENALSEENSSVLRQLRETPFPVIAIKHDQFQTKIYQHKTTYKNPDLVADDISISYDISAGEPYNELNAGIIALASSEYSKINEGEHSNFLVSPVTGFIAANFLEYSAAGESRSKIQQGLTWDAENNWPLSEWMESINETSFTDHLSLSNQSLVNQFWGQTDYSFSESYLSALSEDFQLNNISFDYLTSSDIFSDELEANIFDEFLYEFSPIDSILASMNNDSRLTFTSQLDIEAEWATDASNITNIEGVWGANGKSLKMPMLQWQGIFRRYDTENYRSVIIPLANRVTSLTIIMPIDQMSFDLVESSLSTVLNDIEQSYTNVSMDFVLPYFSVQTKSQISRLIASGSYVGNMLDKTAIARSKAPTFSYEPSYTPGSTVYTTSPYTTVSKVMLSDYSTVNDLGYLKRQSLVGESFFDVSSKGVNIQSIVATALQATEDEPPILVYPSGGSGFTQYTITSPSGTTFFHTIVGGGVSGGSSSTFPFPSCETVIEKRGNKQVTPFIFVVKDLSTNSILQLGKIEDLEGLEDKRNVCLKERKAYSADIWPTYPRQEVELDVHVNTADYLTRTPDVVDDSELTQKTIDQYHPYIMAQHKLNDSANRIVSPITENLIKTQVLLGSYHSNFDSVLTPSEMLSIANTLSEFQNSSVWIETDYELREQYLDQLSLLNDELNIIDILAAPDALISKVELWTENLVPKDYLHKLINNRTRLLFSTSSSTHFENIGDTVIGVFRNNNNFWSKVEAVNIKGNFKSSFNDAFNALEIPHPESNTDLLIISPKPGHFELVENLLLKSIALFDENAIEQEAHLILPQIEFSTAQVNDDYKDQRAFKYVSEIRDLRARPQINTQHVSISQYGIKLVSNSLAAFVAPPDAPERDGIDENATEESDFFEIGGNDAFGKNPIKTEAFNCEALNDDKATHPFIMVLRDSLNKSIMQIIRITAVQEHRIIGDSEYCLPSG